MTIEGLALSQISDAGQTTLDWPELSSLNGGPIASEESMEGTLVSRRALYRVETAAQNSAEEMVRIGYLRVDSPPQRIFINFTKWLGHIFRQEARLG